jgi:phosphopantothenoylcysteine decarboxylase/phosphopantothenate--cysteine ligase
MGYALASAAVEAGADVTLISGPVTLPAPDGVKRIEVESALEMQTAVMHQVTTADIFIACAAVADYRLTEPHASKLKKDPDTLELKLVRNPDILAEVASLPQPPFTVGCAAETDNLRVHALAKLKQKGVDMIAANLVGAARGFTTDDNALLVLWADGEHEFSLMPKTKLARQLLALAAKLYQSRIRPHAKNQKHTTENS